MSGEEGKNVFSFFLRFPTLTAILIIKTVSKRVYVFLIFFFALLYYRIHFEARNVHISAFAILMHHKSNKKKE